VCGSGIGAFVFAPLSNFLLAYYGGWRSAYWIIAGIVLNLVVLGALFRPLQARTIRFASSFLCTVLIALIQELLL
jgi:hypothetical protein